MNRHKPGKSTKSMMFLSLLRLQDIIILPKWYGEAAELYFDCPENGELHIPSQPTFSHFYLWAEVPGLTLLHICWWTVMLVSPDGSTFLFTTKITSPLCKFLGIYSQSNQIDSFEIKFDKNVILGGVYMRPEIKSNLNEIWIHDKRSSVYITFHYGRNETNFVSGVARDKRPIK